MADADLDAIRKARLEQLKAQGGGGGGGGAGPQMGGGGGGGGPGQAEQQKQQEQEARQHILGQILHPEAADRLGRIRLVKEQRATDVENRLITLARTGQLRQKVTEDQLKELLSAISESGTGGEGGSSGGAGRIVVNRRKGWEDEDDVDDLLDL